jgi:hypothetical protein
MKKTFLLTALLGLFTPAVHAQYDLSWHKIAGGGGNSSGGGYTVSGTIGQHDASGTLSGGSYQLVGGFWSLISVVSAVNSPLLSIKHTGSSQVIVSWPAPSTGFVLQQSTNLTRTNNWVTSGYSVTTAGGTNYITIAPPPGEALYFRLVNP